MLGYSQRFHGRSSLKFVHQRGKTVRSRFFSVKYIKNDRRKNFRAAVIVSRKVSGSAVVRNRIRRRLYECVRQFSPEITGAYDLVFVAHSSELASTKTETIEAAVRDLLKQTGAIKDKSAAKEHDMINREEK